jgi:hypothetical protein
VNLIKATGACGLLSAYSGTQSGKSLGGKLANKINQFSKMSLVNVETRKNPSDTTLFYKQYIFQNLLFLRHSVTKSNIDFKQLKNRSLPLTKKTGVFFREFHRTFHWVFAPHLERNWDKV